jgi:hypothetical protein
MRKSGEELRLVIPSEVEGFRGAAASMAGSLDFARDDEELIS